MNKIFHSAMSINIRAMYMYDSKKQDSLLLPVISVKAYVVVWGLFTPRNLDKGSDDIL